MVVSSYLPRLVSCGAAREKEALHSRIIDYYLLGAVPGSAKLFVATIKRDMVSKPYVYRLTS